MPPNDLVRLRHMLEAAREAVLPAAGRGAAEIARERILMLALVRSIEVAGETASRVIPETRQAQPEIPWADIIGMRHRLVHA